MIVRRWLSPRPGCRSSRMERPSRRPHCTRMSFRPLLRHLPPLQHNHTPNAAILATFGDLGFKYGFWPLNYRFPHCAVYHVFMFCVSQEMQSCFSWMTLNSYISLLNYSSSGAPNLLLKLKDLWHLTFRWISLVVFTKLPFYRTSSYKDTVRYEIVPLEKPPKTLHSSSEKNTTVQYYYARVTLSSQ